MKNEELEKIKAINQHISDALQQWSDTMLVADADEWAYYLDYSDLDALNVIFMMNHVLQNKAIKSGYLKSPEEAYEKALAFKKAIKDFCGIDTIELTRKSLGIKNKENGDKG